MTGRVAASGTVGELLASRRRDRFVGRAAELELFRAALAAPGEPPFCVLHLHGPGGIGKSALLEAFCGAAVAAGAFVVRVGGQDVAPDPAAVLSLLARSLRVPRDEDAPVRLPDDAGAGRLVLLVDAYERLASLDDWFRCSLVPRLPASAITVLAGREPPTPAWRADAAWRELLRVVSLRNWSPPESRRFLQACGVDGELHEAVLSLAHGHPFGTSLLADTVLRGGRVPDPPPPGLVGELLRRFLDVVPDARHQRALEVCALARVTSEELLRSVLEREDDARELFGWLRRLSFVETAPEGVRPHELARDVLDADLRWRDPEAYRAVFRAVRGHLHRRLRSADGTEVLRLLFDQKFLFRHLPGVLSPVDWGTWGRRLPEPARREEHPRIVSLIGDAEGEQSARIAGHWLRLQPEGFHVLRDGNGGVDGVLGLLDLTAASAQDVGADPGAAAAWRHARRNAPPRPGEAVTQTRFVVDRAAYQGPSPTMNAASVLTISRYLRTPALAWDFLTLADPGRWEEYFAIADLPRAEGADFRVAGRTYGLFAHDFRRVPVDAWLELVTERALAQDFTVPAAGAREPEVLVLSQPEFEAAVRQALRDLTRPDLLARNPLLRTRLVRHRAGGEPDGDALAVVVREAVASLGEHPRDDKLLRAVDRTYVRPAATQERAAAVLGLPFGTYRRHLAQGVARVVERLWDLEVYGPAPR